MKDFPRYGASTDTLVHALKGCLIAQAVLTLGGLDGRLLTKDYLYCIDWIEDVMRILEKKSGFGMIVCDSNGFVIGGGGRFKNKEIMTEWVELYAFKEGIKIARSLNSANAILEADCASLVNRFKNCKEDITIIGYCTK
ncbi:hypothetical protein Godav_027820 [Gossypium davidsonii]|uniref:RNase H type-1 domain-containing protein n=2 Tax=Gossypium TaxID=3633 RepID=A0A7J8RXA2_GOSDV|nr:hypothetical protein [Gossypium davidsonii]MBA0653864.1 hypothetical protein [Gossypium klotzschianum]